MITSDGDEVITFESVDSQGEALGLAEAMNLVEFAKIQLTAEMVRLLIAGDEDEDE